jgi:hypothetical protein
LVVGHFLTPKNGLHHRFFVFFGNGNVVDNLFDGLRVSVIFDLSYGLNFQ